MNVLAIDTAGKTAGVAVMQGETLVYESYLAAGTTHSETLMPMVDTALKAANMTCAQIDLFAVCAGPGSFTGLRIGLAAVKGLAFPTSASCAGVSTLEALACGYPGSGTVIPALDARRGEVYWAAFDLESKKRLTEDSAAPAASLADFVEKCKKPAFFVGDGAALCYNMYSSVPGILPCPEALSRGRAVGICLAALRMEREGQTCAAAQLLPSYHRLSQAERERAQREQAAQT